MRVLSILAAAVVAMPAVLSVSVADEYQRKALVEDEIKRHVVDECDFYLRYGKNKIDFSPEEASKIVSAIHKRNRSRKAGLVKQIYSVVRSNRSFYLRSRVYDIYYGVCIERISVRDAEVRITDVVGERVGEHLLTLDESIEANYTSNKNSVRAVRDKDRIGVLNVINLQEVEQYTIAKNRSVIQEYKHDIELWEW